MAKASEQDIEKRLISLRKGPWSPEEDHKLIAYISRYGIWNWSKMAKPAGLQRSGKSCRLRWVNYLKPGIKRGNFSREEDETIIQLHGRLGNRWSAIASRLAGRTDNEIKNYWHAHLSKRFKYNISHPTTKDHNFQLSNNDIEAQRKSSSHIAPKAILNSELSVSVSVSGVVQLSPQFSADDTLPSSTFNLQPPPAAEIFQPITDQDYAINSSEQPFTFENYGSIYAEEPCPWSNIPQPTMMFGSTF